MAYSDKEVAVLTKAVEDNGSITFDMLEDLAVEVVKTPRSVLAKVKQLGLPYTPKEKAPKREKGVTKAELVAAIAKNIGASENDLDGLTKATAKALGKLVELT
jgi:phage-related minor tail protein